MISHCFFLSLFLYLFAYFDTLFRWAFHSGSEFLAERAVVGHSLYLFCLSFFKGSFLGVVGLLLFL